MNFNTVSANDNREVPQTLPAKTAKPGKMVEVLGMTDYFKSANTVFNAAITPGVSIRIWGTYGNHVNGPQVFDRTFKIGDVVEHGSYNLSYTGPITSIAPATVSVKDFNATKRMKLVEFCQRNCLLDLNKIAARNAAWMD